MPGASRIPAGVEKMDDLMINAVDVRSADAELLVARLDAELDRRNGTVVTEFVAANRLADHATFLVGYVAGRPVACGAFRPMDAGAAEVKRMYVEPEFRGRGIARRVLAELEERARRDGFSRTRLETGIYQPEAIRLYESAGYHRIDNYGVYAGCADSVCFEKSL
jgi:GNAT superfamily N-acetyltransferase